MFQETYEAGYDLEEVRQKALDMGMVPVEEIAQTHIFVTRPPVQTEEPVTGWERVSTYLTGRFA